MQVLLPFTPSTHTTSAISRRLLLLTLYRGGTEEGKKKVPGSFLRHLRSAAISPETERSSHRRRPSINLAAVSRRRRNHHHCVSSCYVAQPPSYYPRSAGLPRRLRVLRHRTPLQPHRRETSVSHHRRGGSSLPLLVGGGKIAIAVYALLLIEEENRALSRDFLQPRHRPTVDNAIDELGRRSPSSTPIAVKPQPGLQGLRLMLAGDYELLTASYRTPSLWLPLERRKTRRG
nr:hypothetical protein Iba_chr01aCG4540 [Ipomoea batatas]